MKLSVIIVNYNVKLLLSQCLQSVQKALQLVDGEIIVVDNNSDDDSCLMVREDFPKVILLENKTNLGFSKANNQGIRRAKGDYILLLNPDTLVAEDCFLKCLGFMDQTPNAGALGVRMIDGRGRFLPESKRGLPTPWVAFCKIFGLTRLFPQSRRFARYYLGHLPSDRIVEIEVVAGAFMLLHRPALAQSGLLDEDFFMYGEDIDLSYRISRCGFRNYYFPGTTILHYKGESTRKGSLNYVVLFYRAMVIFSKKHFATRLNGMFVALIHLAVYVRAFLSVLSRLVRCILSPAMRLLTRLRSRKAPRSLILNSIADLEQALRELQDPANTKQPELLIFQLDAIPTATIISCMEQLAHMHIRFRIVSR